MVAIITLLSITLFVLVCTYLMLKNALEFMANKLIDIDTDFERIIKILERLSKNK